MTFDTVTGNGSEAVSVKVEFYGELRRFSTSSSSSFASLQEDVAKVLNVDRTKELVIKYRDDEGDMITLSSDLELKSAVSSGSVLRLFVSYKGSSAQVQAQVPVTDVNMVDVSKEKAAPVPQVPLYPTVAPGAPEVPPPPAGFPQPFLGPHSAPTGFPCGGPWQHHGRGHHGGWGHHPHPHPHGGWGHRGWGRGGWKHHKYGMSGEAPAWVQNQDALVAQVEELGFDVKKEKIIKMLWKADGNVEVVMNKLAAKREKRDWKMAKREEKCLRKEEKRHCKQNQ